MINSHYFFITIPFTTICSSKNPLFFQALNHSELHWCSLPRALSWHNAAASHTHITWSSGIPRWIAAPPAPAHIRAHPKPQQRHAPLDPVPLASASALPGHRRKHGSPHAYDRTASLARYTQRPALRCRGCCSARRGCGLRRCPLRQS